MKEYKGLSKEVWLQIEVSAALRDGRARTDTLQLDNENIYRWNLALIILNPDSQYYGGYFKALMTFPTDYPYVPPGSCVSS